jgi:hypothetical protein
LNCKCGKAIKETTEPSIVELDDGTIQYFCTHACRRQRLKGLTGYQTNGLSVRNDCIGLSVQTESKIFGEERGGEPVRSAATGKKRRRSE